MLLHQVLLRSALTFFVIATPATAYLAPPNNSYEYVVVGSGAGGGTVAASLARQGHSVLLIEAGGDHGGDLLQEVPGMSATAAENEEMSWRFWVRHFRNETQGRRDSKFNYRLPDGSVYTGLHPPDGAEPLGTYYPRGATLGGSTQVNAMSFQLPPDHDWDSIAEFTGDDSWSASAMSRYFLEVENCTYLPEGTPGHGFDGFVSSNRNNVSYITSRPGVMEILSNWARETEDIEGQGSLGPEHMTELLTRDTNVEKYRYTPGVFRDVSATTAMRRRSGARSYVNATIAAGYPLTLSMNSLATRVLFEQGRRKPKAIGVEYLVGEGLYGADRRYDPVQNGSLRIVSAANEVILAGGAFNTPQLLKLSGIGPRQELEGFNIPVLVDLPGVGANLHDHSEGVFSINASVPWENAPSAACNFSLGVEDPCMIEWQTSGTGPYGEAGAPLCVRFRSSVSTSDLVDVWAFGTPNYMFRGFLPGYSQTPASPPSWSMSMIKVHSPGEFSNGSVTLRSSNPREPPIINFDWLTGDRGHRDIKALTEMAALLERSFNDAPAPYTPMTRHQPRVGADVGQSIKDEAFGHHASSSCRMGPIDDPEACLDPQLRVNGVSRLRMVVASVFPFTPSAFPVLPITMMGHKAADLISRGAVKFRKV